MTQLLALLLVFNWLAVVRGAVTLPGGLSVKNLLLYGTVALIGTNFLFGQRFKLERPQIIIAFGILIIYALISTVVVSSLELYPYYSLRDGILRIKGDMLDWCFYFVIFTLGVSKLRDAERLLALLAGLVGASSVLTLWNATGIFVIGKPAFVVHGEGLPRLDGFFGHANETGSLMAAYLPVLLAMFGGARGGMRALWLGLIVATCMLLVGTMSRGALVGLVFGALILSLRMPRFISLGRYFKWGAIALLLALLIVPFVGAGYLVQFAERFTGVSTVSATQMTSGRTELFMMGIDGMLRKPGSFALGMGWNSWDANGFTFLPHNEYLWFYFDLGIVGLVGFTYIFVSIYRYARQTVELAPDARARQLPLAFCAWILIFCICMITANIHTPWAHVWPLMGLMVRYCYLYREQLAAEKAPAVTPARPPVRRAVPAAGVARNPRQPDARWLRRP